MTTSKPEVIPSQISSPTGRARCRPVGRGAFPRDGGDTRSMGGEGPVLPRPAHRLATGARTWLRLRDP